MQPVPLLDSNMSPFVKLYVKKRRGRVELVDYNKITVRMQRLSWNLNMEYIDIANVVRKVIDGLYCGVSTWELDNLAAETCASMSTIHPDYGTLAARITASNLHKETDSKFSSVVKRLHENVHAKKLCPMPLVSDEFYQDVMANQDALDKAIVYDRDFDFTYFGLKTLEKAYLLRCNDKVVERPQHLLMRVSVALHGRNLEKILETYEAMSKKYFIHATPTLFNAGTKRAGLSSCFLLSATAEDDSIENIYKLMTECAVISKYAGGIGLSIHDIRAKNSLIMSTNGKSEGIIPMIKVYDKTVQYVTQSNKRPGSVALFLEPWHPESREYIKLKVNHGKEEERAKNLFYGLWIPDLFMRKAKTGQDWCLFCPNEAPGLSDTYGEEFERLYHQYEKQKLYREKVSAQKLLQDIIECQVRTGGPYMCYKDAANRKNNQKHIGVIRGSNLCVEIMQYADHHETSVCNLGSLCLPSFVEKNDRGIQFNFDMLFKMTQILTRNLDRVVDLTCYPSEKARYSNLRHRPMGIGVSGLADVFSLMWIPFDSVRARELNKQIFETIAFASYSASCDLAKELGSYPTYEGSEFSKGKFQWDLWEEETGQKIQHSGMWDWESLRVKMNQYGMRNSLLTATMPTASTSQIMGVTEAFEPLGSNVYKRITLSGEFPVINRHLIKDLCERGIWDDHIKNQIIEHEGSIQKIAEIPKEIREIYKITWDLSQKVIIDMSAERGPYIDQSQSLNIFMAQPSFASMTSLHFYAWSKGLKTGMYYLKQKPANKPLQITVQRNKVDTKTKRTLSSRKEIDDENGARCSLKNEDGTCLSCSA
jgi:ribonucleoside-diphosphate reductase subunit M1